MINEADSVLPIYLYLSKKKKKKSLIYRVNQSITINKQYINVLCMNIKRVLGNFAN